VAVVSVTGITPEDAFIGRLQLMSVQMLVLSVVLELICIHIAGYCCCY